MPTPAASELTGPAAFQQAQRKARFGHRDWLCWRNAAGVIAAPKTRENVKRMLLDSGTKGNWSLICADNGVPMRGFWWLGINLIRQCERGM